MKSLLSIQENADKKRLEKIKENISTMHDNEIISTMQCFYDEENIIKALTYISEEKIKNISILLTSHLYDDKTKLIVIDKYEEKHNDDSFIPSVISNIISPSKQEELCLFFFEKYKYSNKTAKLLSSITNDRFKLDHLYLLTKDERNEVLSTMNDTYIYTNIKQEHNKDEKLKLICMLKSKDYLEPLFQECSVEDKDYIMTNLRSEPMKKRLTNLYYNKNIKTYKILRDNYLESNVDSVNTSLIDPNITFGVELEASNDYIDSFYLEMEKDLFNYEIKKDVSVTKGIEFVSPILHYTKNDLSKLKRICEILKTCGFETNETCGGHVHVGAEYLSTSEELLTFLYLYCNTEEIIYLISNKENSEIRDNVFYYAKPISKDFKKAISKNIKFDENNLLILYNICKTVIDHNRYTGLNLTNLGEYNKNTIEFRMPNGEIDFNELILNITLFCKLLELGKELTYTKDINKLQELQKLSDESLNDKQKLEILLDLLFENEEQKVPYRNRYYSNINENDLDFKHKNLVFRKESLC